MTDREVLQAIAARSRNDCPKFFHSVEGFRRLPLEQLIEGTFNPLKAVEHLSDSFRRIHKCLPSGDCRGVSCPLT